MTFDPMQIAKLNADLSRLNVREREQSGRKLAFIEGWFAEVEANRIFGHHAWDSETTELRLVAEAARKIGSAANPGWGVSYIAKVRVTVTTPEGHKVIRDGIGSGHGIDRDLGLAHESAAKEAATDAEKRALKTFGFPFGLALYDKTQAHVADEPQAPSRKSAAQAKRDGDADRLNANIDAADAEWLDGFEEHFDDLTAELPLSWLDPLRNRIILRREEIAGAANVAEAEAELDQGFRETIDRGGPDRVAGNARQVAHA